MKFVGGVACRWRPRPAHVNDLDPNQHLPLIKRFQYPKLTLTFIEMSEVLTLDYASGAAAAATSAPAATRPSLARKRRATGLSIPQIGEIPLTEPPRVPSSLSLSSDTSVDLGDDDSQTDSLKRIRHDSGVSTLSDESYPQTASISTYSPDYSLGSCSCDSSNSLVIGGRTGQIPAFTHNSTIGDFRIIGAGRDVAKAIHVHTNEIYDCKILTPSAFNVVSRVMERLDLADRYYRRVDIDELKEAILPLKTEIVEENCGRVVQFTPIFKSTLHSFRAQRGTEVSEAELVPIFEQIIRLLAFCHSIGIIVRDLKPRKLVFDYKGKLRLSDVRDCVVVEDPELDTVYEKFGSPAYVQPEVLSTCGAGYSGKAADMWSLGVLMYLLLLGRYPFFDSTPVGVFARIKQARVAIPANCHISKYSKILLISLLQKCPAQRPSAESLVFIPWSPLKTQPSRGGSPVSRRVIEELITQAGLNDLASSPPAEVTEGRPAVSSDGQPTRPPVPQIMSSLEDLRAMFLTAQRYFSNRANQP